MGARPDGSRGMVIVNVCTITGPKLRFHRVEKWYTHDKTGTLHMLRDGQWETKRLSRQHIGVYAERVDTIWPVWESPTVAVRSE